MYVVKNKVIKKFMYKLSICVVKMTYKCIDNDTRIRNLRSETMKIIKVKDNDQLSLEAVKRIIEVLNSNKNPVLGLATGSTPERTYQLLIEKYNNKEITFQNTTTFNLDEYVGLNPTDEFSYHYYMNINLFDHVDIKKENTFIPNGLAENLQNECELFEQTIKERGPIHLQILGVGPNGHIGFNEPGTPFTSRTHIAKLEESTRQANSRFFSSIDEVPTEAITMGIATIMEAEQIILLVQGEHKADILQKIVHGDVTEDVPASILQLHPNATLITDIDV